MKSNGGVIAGGEVRRAADHDDPLRAGGRHARRGAGRRAGGLREGDHARRRRHVDRRGRHHRRPPDPHHRGIGRPLRGQGPDGRRDHRRHRRRLDRLGVAGGHAEGRAALGRGRSRARSATRAAGAEPTTTDAFLLLGHIPEHLLGGEIPLDRAAAEAVYDRLAESVGLSREACAAGVLEIAAWNQANAIRQVTVKRGLDVRDFDLCAFGGSGPLTACRLIDILGLRTVFVPRDPGNLSAFGLLATDLRSDHVQTLVRRHDQLDVGRAGARAGAARGAGARRRRGPRGLRRALRGPALLRAGVRDPRRPRPTGRSTRLRRARSRRASTTPTSARTATATATTPARSSSG